MGTPARPAQLKRRRRPPAPALLHLRRPAQRLLLALRALRREQLLLRASRAPPLLAADARPLGQSGLPTAARTPTLAPPSPPFSRRRIRSFRLPGVREK